MNGSTFRLLLALAGTAAVGFVIGRMSSQRARVERPFAEADPFVPEPEPQSRKPRASTDFTGYTFASEQPREARPQTPALSTDATARAAELMDEVDGLLEQLKTKKTKGA